MRECSCNILIVRVLRQYIGLDVSYSYLILLFSSQSFTQELDAPSLTHVHTEQAKFFCRHIRQLMYSHAQSSSYNSEDDIWEENEAQQQ